MRTRFLFVSLIFLGAFLIPAQSCHSTNSFQNVSINPHYNETSRTCNISHGMESVNEEEQFVLNEQGNPIYWNQEDFIPVIVNTANMSRQIQIEIFYAIEYWNNQIGRPFLAYHTGNVNNSDFGSIYIVMDPIEESNSCGHVTLLGTTTRYYGLSPFGRRREVVNAALIKIWNRIVSGNHMSLQRLIVHELGHALGLKHDSDINSVMYPSVETTSWHIEERDLEYVRRIVEHLKN